MSKSLPTDDRSVRPFWRQASPVLFLVLLFLLNFISRIILAPLLPTIEKELAISHAQAGSLFFFVSVGYVIGLFGSGFLAARFTHRLTIVISGSGIGLALVVISLADSLWAIRAVLLSLGFAAGLYIPSAIATITAVVEQPHWGKAIAVHELAPNLAFFLGPFTAELFLQWGSWRMALNLIGAASLAASLAYLRWGRGGDFPGESPTSGAFGTLVSTPAFWIMLALFGIGVSTTLGVYAMLPLYLVSERHLHLSWANTLLALSRSYGPVLGIAGGWASDNLGPRPTMVISLIFTGVMTLLLGAVSNVLITTIVLLQPLLAVCFFPAAFAALALITPPAARNLAVGFTVPFGYIIGGGAVPMFIGFMGDAGSFAKGFFLTGLLIVVGAALVLILKLPRSKRGQKQVVMNANGDL